MSNHLDPTLRYGPHDTPSEPRRSAYTRNALGDQGFIRAWTRWINHLEDELWQAKASRERLIILSGQK